MQPPGKRPMPWADYQRGLRRDAVSVAPARRAAFTVLRRVFEQGAFADRALHTAAADLGQRDRALATTLAYGTVQRKRTLDHCSPGSYRGRSRSSSRRCWRRCGSASSRSLFLGGVTDYAAVNESVELAKASSRGGAQLVNAVLRRATPEAQQASRQARRQDRARAAVLHSVPDWLAELWWRELGPEQARALLASVNTPAEIGDPRQHAASDARAGAGRACRHPTR